MNDCTSRGEEGAVATDRDEHTQDAQFLKTTRITLRNKRGLHARASAKFAQLATSFDAKIEVTSCNDVCQETVVGDSIMELLLLGSACGEDISITAHGPDADAAIKALSALVESRFGEDE
ncbi:MAG: HPr family phosphocarrier protein [Robiginitomaculum sp.]|nr:HPr family phosphocarrier protein [Robiginitomaculum sp.]